MTSPHRRRRGPLSSAPTAVSRTQKPCAPRCTSLTWTTTSTPKRTWRTAAWKTCWARRREPVRKTGRRRLPSCCQRWAPFGRWSPPWRRNGRRKKRSCITSGSGELSPWFSTDSSSSCTSPSTSWAWSPSSSERFCQADNSVL